VFAADGLYTAQDPLDPNLIYYESQGGNISRRNLATGEVVNLKARTVSNNTYGQQIAALKGPNGTPTPEQQKQIDDIRARMKRELADPTVANRWNWNTPFFVSAHDPTWLRVSSGYDAEGNVAPDGSGGITRDATGAEENATITVMTESPIRAGMLVVGTDDGKVWITSNDGGRWIDISDRFAGVPAMTHVSSVEPSHFDTSTVYVALDNHRRGDFKPYLFVSNDFGKTFRSIASNLPTGVNGPPASVYVVRVDPVNPNLLYAGTETGVFASLNKGQSWFPLQANLPTVPVYDLKIHPRDHEMIAATHGRGVQIIDVAPLQQMSASVLSVQAHLFAPTVAFDYGQPPPPSETRAQRMWRIDGGPDGAEIVYRLAAPAATPPRVLIMNAAGDTIARLNGTNNAGLNRVSWNMQILTPEAANALAQFGGRGGGGGRGGAPGNVNVPGFPAGFNPRPAEQNTPAYTSGSPTAQARELANPQGGRGGRGGAGGGGGGGRGGLAPQSAETGDYRVVLDLGGEKQVRVLRVYKVQAGENAVMVPIPR
jgi:hypothetical protein